MKKVLLINGSPRKKWNTAMLLEKAAEGAAEAGAQIRLVNLYELNFRGCASCFACKRHKDPAAVCILRDDLRPLLEEAMLSDAVIMGSAIYFGNATAGMRALWERLLFMNYTYDNSRPSKFGGSIATGVIYTMNVTGPMLVELGYEPMFKAQSATLARVLNGPSEYLAVTDTLQFSDHSAYMSSSFDPEHKARMREEKFPKDLEAAYRLGARLGAD